MALLVTVIIIGSNCERNQSTVGPTRLRGRIIYNTIENFTFQIRVIFPDDPTNPRRFIDSPLNNIAPKWSPDGTQIAFLSDRSGVLDFYRLYLINDDGTNLRELFDPLIHPEGDQGFSWSPDGCHIALVNRVQGIRTNRRQLYILDVETLERQLVVPALPERFSPDWSPDGTRIAFITESPGNITMDILSYPDLSIRSIDFDMNRMDFPRWSPDSRSLAFVGAPNELSPFQVFVAEEPEFAVRQISTIEDGISIPGPVTWSPDGQRIVFSAPGIGVRNRDLYSIQIDGTQLTRLTTSSYDEIAPDWTLHE